jgi:hypothetical protein
MRNKKHTNEKPAGSHKPKSLGELHREVLDRINKMSPAQGFQSLVKSGIYTQDGKLTKLYGG